MRSQAARLPAILGVEDATGSLQGMVAVEQRQVPVEEHYNKSCTSDRPNECTMNYRFNIECPDPN